MANHEKEWPGVVDVVLVDGRAVELDLTNDPDAPPSGTNPKTFRAWALRRVLDGVGGQSRMTFETTTGSYIAGNMIVEVKP